MVHSQAELVEYLVCDAGTRRVDNSVFGCAFLLTVRVSSAVFYLNLLPGFEIGALRLAVLGPAEFGLLGVVEASWQVENFSEAGNSAFLGLWLPGEEDAVGFTWLLVCLVGREFKRRELAVCVFLHLVAGGVAHIHDVLLGVVWHIGLHTVVLELKLEAVSRFVVGRSYLIHNVPVLHGLC